MKPKFNTDDAFKHILNIWGIYQAKYKV